MGKRTCRNCSGVLFDSEETNIKVTNLSNNIKYYTYGITKEPKNSEVPLKILSEYKEKLNEYLEDNEFICSCFYKQNVDKNHRLFNLENNIKELDSLIESTKQHKEKEMEYLIQAIRRQAGTTNERIDLGSNQEKFTEESYKKINKINWWTGEGSGNL